MADNMHIGSCLCGDVSIEAVGDPSLVAACHCKSCRKHTGAPVAVFADYLKSRVRFTDAQPKLYQSSPGVYRGFCATCGSTLSYQANNHPDMIHLHIGVFDSPDMFSPTANENTGTKLPWVCVSTGNVDGDKD